MFYHASPKGNLTHLTPHVSEHGESLIYFSTKRENVLVYLSNAVERYARETGFEYDGTWQTWGSYGFEPDGRLRLEEYYPNALERTYRGVSGTIYHADQVIAADVELSIPDVVASREPVAVTGTEFVPDAYEAILEAERLGLLTIERYESLTEAKKAWIARIVRDEYDRATAHPEYRHFLRGVFPNVFEELK